MNRISQMKNLRKSAFKISNKTRFILVYNNVIILNKKIKNKLYSKILVVKINGINRWIYYNERALYIFRLNYSK